MKSLKVPNAMRWVDRVALRLDEPNVILNHSKTAGLPNRTRRFVPHDGLVEWWNTKQSRSVGECRSGRTLCLEQIGGQGCILHQPLGLDVIEWGQQVIFGDLLAPFDSLAPPLVISRWVSIADYYTWVFLTSNIFTAAVVLPE